MQAEAPGKSMRSGHREPHVLGCEVRAFLCGQHGQMAEQRAGIPVVAPPHPDNWVDAVLVAVIEAYDMLAFMTVTPLRESPMCMGGTEEDSCGMI